MEKFSVSTEGKGKELASDVYFVQIPDDKRKSTGAGKVRMPR